MLYFCHLKTDGSKCRFVQKKSICIVHASKSPKTETKGLGTDAIFACQYVVAARQRVHIGGIG